MLCRGCTCHCFTVSLARKSLPYLNDTGPSFAVAGHCLATMVRNAASPYRDCTAPDSALPQPCKTSGNSNTPRRYRRLAEPYPDDTGPYPAAGARNCGLAYPCITTRYRCIAKLYRHNIRLHATLPSGSCTSLGPRTTSPYHGDTSPHCTITSPYFASPLLCGT
jgi:hypothetical protein